MGKGIGAEDKDSVMVGIVLKVLCLWQLPEGKSI